MRSNSIRIMTIWDNWCQIDRVVDGDTLDVTIDLGFSVYSTERVRLAGVDTAEIYGTKKESDEYKLGIEQSQFVKNWLDDRLTDYPYPFIIETKKDNRGKFGRYIADIYTEDKEEHLNEAIINEYPDATYP